MAPDPSRCPRCSGPLAQHRCPSCSLVLTGPDADRLWQLDTELAGLSVRRDALLAERVHLLAALARPAVPQPAHVPVTSRVRAGSAQNTLLALGALLLGVAVTVFGTVTYERLGAPGRTLVLAVLTAVALLAAPVLLRRGLRATAEAASVLALILGALDAYGLRTLGVGAELAPLTFGALAAGALAVAAVAYDLGVRARVGARLAAPRLAALALLQLTVALSLLAGSAGPEVAAVALAGLAASDAVAGRVLSQDVLARRVAHRLAGAVAGLGLAFAAVTADRPGLAAASVVLLYAGLAAAAARLFAAPLDTPGRAQTLLSALTVLLLAGSAGTLLQGRLGDLGLALVVLAVGGATAACATRLAQARRGAQAGSFLLIAFVGASVAEAALTAAALPFGTLRTPWRGIDAALLGPSFAVPVGDLSWDALVVLVATTLVLAGALLAARRPTTAVLSLLAGGALALAVAPFAVDLPYAVVPGLLTVVAAALLLAPRASGAVRRVAAALPVAGSAVAALALAWALAERTATLIVLPVLLVLVVTMALGVGRIVAAAVGGLLLTGTVTAYAFAAGLAADQTGGLLVAVVLTLVVVAEPRLGRRRPAVEAAAASTALLAVGLSSADPGWLSWTLAGLGLVALLTALREDRRVLAPVGGLLLAASSWVRLAEAEVSAPEPYVVPVALLALLLGHLRRRQVPGTGSTAAYAPGLSALLVPSLLAALTDPTPTRGLVLAVAACVVVLVGARARLRAPLALGGVVLAVDAVDLLAPYVSALPRWTVLATLGAVLLAVGASYEQRRRDVTALRERFDALA